ncbi:fumarylacetoacetate hydrolase family protein [Halanaerocella petrolearia]
MQLVRFNNQQGEVEYGVLKNQEVQVITGEITGDYQLTDKSYSLAEVELLAPCQPSKVVCVGLNYKDHAQELDMELPEEPIIFLKPATAVVGPGDYIKYPEMSQQVDYEAELGVVIKKETKNIEVEEAREHILGYTCANDVTARDLQQKDGQWTRAKAFDTFAPLGPVIDTEVGPDSLKIRLLKNGEVKQKSNTSQMIFSVPELVIFISKIMTLNSGDVILTGTPIGVGEIKKGDEVEVRIETIGSLKNKIREK